MKPPAPRHRFPPCTYGTRGDVEPFVTLAKRVQSAGRKVLLATSARFETYAWQHHVPIFPMSDEPLAAIETQEGRAVTDGGAGRARRVAAGLRLLRRAGPNNAGLMQQVWDAARSHRPHAIVFHPKLFAAPHVAEKLGAPSFAPEWHAHQVAAAQGPDGFQARLRPPAELRGSGNGSQRILPRGPP